MGAFSTQPVLPSAIALRQLHWLSIKQRIHVKIATLTYRTLQSVSPSYLSSLINFNNPPRPLRSSSFNLLCVPYRQGHWSSQSFPVHSPNGLEFYSTEHQAIIIHLFFQMQSQNSHIFPSRLAMFSTSLHQHL